MRLAPLVSTLALALVAKGAHAQHRDAYSASFDRVRASAPVPRNALRSPLVPASKPALPVFAAAVDVRRDAPSFLWAGQGAWSLGSAAASMRPTDAARVHLGRLANLHGLSPSAVASAVVREVHDTGRGGVIVILGQDVDGIPIFREKAKLLLQRGSLDLIAASGHLHGAAIPRTRQGKALFSRSPQQAIGFALDDLHGTGASPGALVEVARGEGGYRRFDLAAPSAMIRFTRPARVKEVFYPMNDHLVPGYYVEVWTKRVGSHAGADVFAHVIAADDGRVLHRANLTSHAAFQYRVWAETTGDRRPFDGPTADYTPHPTGVPDGSYPPYVAPSLITMDGFNASPDGSADPWLGAGAKETRGNNVDAYADDDDPDGFSPGDIRASVTAPGVFDRVFDTSISPTANDEQRMASVTQLFYTTNWLHDYWYDSGFDEAAGNAQGNNFGRGGAASDRLIAQAQDGAALGNLDNANMSTPADGESPQMQMYLWSGPETRQLGVDPIGQSLDSGSASFGPKDFSVTGAVVLVNDGQGSVTDACQTIKNDLTGKIALLDRGTCTFQEKVQRAEAKGAIGVLMANNVAGSPPQMPGDDTANPTIPVLSVSIEDADAIKAALGGGPVTATLARTVGALVDGSIDNMVVAHEWGHYLHHRLVDSELNQAAGESEGWGDFIALMLSVRETDNLGGTFADTVYATVAGNNAGYFGTRRFPYSVDFTKNALTFKHISDDEPIPTGMPMQDSGAEQNSEAHNTGEVWGVMLFEAYVALLRESQGPAPRYTFQEAQRRMADYVVSGMKLAPEEPTFTEQRDAILAAAFSADQADALVLAQAFARRGAGSCARAPERNSPDNTGVIESFEVAPAMNVVSVAVAADAKSCDGDDILDAEESGHVIVKIMNGGIAPLTGTEVTLEAIAAGVRFPEGTKATLASIDAFGMAEVRFAIEIDRTLTTTEPMVLTATATNAAACAPMASRAEVFRLNYDNALAASASDDFESDIDVWKSAGAESNLVWSKAVSTSANHTYRGLDLGHPSDTAITSPAFQASATEGVVISFRHRHTFEAGPDGDTGPDVYWDGAVIEISTDLGKTWKDVEEYGGNPGYGGQIDNSSGNPLGGRMGLVKSNASWPEMDTVTLNLGMSLSGTAAQIRFRIGSDAEVDAFGWEIDDVAITGIDNTPFSAISADVATCTQAPVADAGADHTVKTGEGVTLDASKSKDPDGDPLTFSWTQTAGPAVALTGAKSMAAAFTAPAVEKRTTLTFDVAVSDGILGANDTVDVVIEPEVTPTLEAAGGCACEAQPSRDGRAAWSLVAAAMLALRRRRRAARAS